MQVRIRGNADRPSRSCQPHAMQPEGRPDAPDAPAQEPPLRSRSLVPAVVVVAVVVVLAVPVVATGVSMWINRSREEGATLVILSGRDPSGTRQKLVERWNAEHSGIPVKLTEIDVGWDAAGQREDFQRQIREKAASIVNIDVAYLPEFAASRNDHGLGLLAPLPDGTPTDGFMQTPLDACRWEGRLYCLPFNTDVGMTFTRLGTTPPANWLDDGVSQGPVSLQIGGSNEAFVVNLLENVLSVDPKLLPERLAKGERFTVDVNAWRAAVGKLRAAYWAGRVRSAVTEEESVRAFNDRMVEHMRNWPSRAKDVRQRVELSPLPVAGILGGQSLAVVDRGLTKKHLARAAAVISYLTSEQSEERLLLDGGFAPTRLATYDLPTSRALPHTASLRQAVRSARARPIVPGYGAVSDVIVRYLKPAIVDPDPAPIDDRFAAALQAALAW